MKTLASLAITATVLAATPALAQSRYDQNQYNRSPYSQSQYDQSQYSQSRAQQTGSAQTAEAGVERDVVAAVQQRLQQQGYQAGNSSGQITSDTRNSILNYQARNGLRPTGEIDLATLASMGIGVNVAGVTPTTGAQAAQRGGATSLGETAQGSIITVEPQTAAVPQPEVDRFPHQGRNTASGVPGTENLRDEGRNPETFRQGQRYSTENQPGILEPQEVSPSQRYTTTP